MRQNTNQDRTLVQRIVRYRGVVALVVGLMIAGHMTYQHVYVNQMKPTTSTRCERVAAIALLGYSAYRGLYHRRDNS